MESKELVWAKMKRFAPWPGIVTNTPPPYMLKKKGSKNSKCIFFFGTKNFAWVDTVHLSPYALYRGKPVTTKLLKEAVLRCEEYLSDPILYKSNGEADLQTDAERDSDAEFNKLREDDAGTDDESFSVEADGSEPIASTKVQPPKSASATKAARKPAAPKKERNSLPLKFKVGGTKRNANNGDSPHNKRQRMASIDDGAGAVSYAGDVDTDVDLDAVRGRMKVVANASNISESTLSYARSTMSGRNRIDPANVLISRPIMEVEPAVSIDLDTLAPGMESRHIVPSKLRFGFMGLGTMGSGMVKSLINTGHQVFVWNRTFEVCTKFVQAGAQSVPTPADLIDKVDITFSCVANPVVAKEMVFGNCGILSAESLANKGYVEMTGMDDATSIDIGDAITSKGGRYLETQIQGTKYQAENGELLLMSAGDETLYEDCHSCFQAMGSYHVFLGEMGNASKMYMVLQVIAGVSLAAMGEAMALAQKAGLDQNDLLKVFDRSQLASPMLREKSRCMLISDYAPRQQLTHMQKDLKYALTLSENVEQPLPMAAAANEVFKHAKRSGYAEHDSSAVYAKSIL